MTTYCQIIVCEQILLVSPFRQNTRILLFVLHAFNKSAEHRVNVSVCFVLLFFLVLIF